MKSKNVLTKILAVVGTILVWLPILAPLFFTVALLIAEQIFRLDYLMPAELFPVALVGGVLLVWASFWAHSQRRLIGWGLGVAVASLFLGQTAAVVTGLASGEAEPVGWPWLFVLASLIIYTLSIMALGVGGGLLLNNLFKPLPTSAKSF